jgi:hypothetical protein
MVREEGERMERGETKLRGWREKCTGEVDRVVRKDR